MQINNYHELLPIVSSITGELSDLRAQLLMVGGNTRVAKAGMSLPGGYIVKSVSPSSVTIRGEKSGREFVLQLPLAVTPQNHVSDVSKDMKEVEEHMVQEIPPEADSDLGKNLNIIV